MKYKWKILPKTEKKFDNLANFHPIIHQLLANLNIPDEQSAFEFLYPDIERLNVHHLFAEITAAVEYIEKARSANKKIVIHGDYDVDGIVSTTILWDYLYRKYKINSMPIIPDRFSEGYGLSEETIKRAASEGADVIITVDCGIKDSEIIRKYKDIDFIITDHHTYPKDEQGDPIDIKADNLIAVIHPHHPKSRLEYRDICGAAVTWLFIKAMSEKLTPEFDPQEYLELIALATVTDIMPLEDLNRTIVKKGLELIRTSKRVSLDSLCAKLGVNKNEIETYHFGYVFGPRLNAAGRLEDALDAVRLLATNNPKDAEKLTIKLDQLNQERQRLTQQLLKDAETEISNLDESQKLYLIVGEEWPEGILGLVAGKLQEKYNKPVLVASLNPQSGVVKGSARSPKEYHITEALSRLDHLLERYGGHAQAAGFTLKSDNIDDFEKLLIDDANKRLADVDLTPEISIASEVKWSDVNTKFVETVNLLAPFGNGNPTPKFLFKKLKLTAKKSVGRESNHVKLTFDNSIDAIAFNSYNLFQEAKEGDLLDVVGKVELNKWNGNEKLQLKVDDFRLCEDLS